MPARRAQTVLVIVMVVVAILGAFLVMRSDFRHHAHHETVRVLASQSALWSARSAAETAVAELMRDAGDPGAPRYRDLRRRILESTSTADLTDLLSPPHTSPAFRWAGPRRAPGPVGAVELERVRAHVEQISPVPRADGSSLALEDERVALLVVDAAAKATIGGVTVRRALSQVRELKLVLAGPPRPFDEIGVYCGDLRALTDAARANRTRDQIFREIDDARRQLADLPPLLPRAARDRLTAIADGLPTGSTRDRGCPPLPETPAVLIQVTDPHGTKVDLARLDLAATLARDLEQIQQARRPVDTALRAADPARIDELVDQTTMLARYFNQALMHGWLYQHQFRVLARDDAAFQRDVAPYEERLAPPWYRRRTAHKLDAADPVLKEWRAGARRLTGVFDLPGPAPLELSGVISGRPVLVTAGQDVTLKDLAPSTAGEHLTLVADAGRIQLSGTVHASLILGEHATLVADANATLAGTLHWVHPSGHVSLSSRLDADGHAAAGPSALAALAFRGFSPYAVALSPAPFFTEGERE